jgi:cytoskeletal protein CcmA (bactofilin family)
VHIEGRVEGDVHSTVKIFLSATACVHGILHAPQIEVRPGALFEGEFQMKNHRLNKNPATKRAA